MPTQSLQDSETLRMRLAGLDGRSYRAYQEIRGGYAFDRCAVYVDHVQRDPYAAPSRVRVRVPLGVARISESLFDNPVRRFAIEDFLARCVRDAIGETPGRSSPRQRPGSGGSGSISIDAGGQEVLERSAAVVTPDWIEARLQVGLPASGRRILGRAAQELLCDALPAIADRALAGHCPASARQFVDCVENQEWIRDRLSALGLIAFVADGSVLARESGVNDRPLRGAVPFESPASFRVEIPLLHPLEADPQATPASEANSGRNTLRGLGVRRGVTLIVGGGYHGKSTLLRAIERGVYPHVPGDGREWVVADRALVKIRAEDGRRVEQVDIDGFISELPGGRSTRRFDSDDASGSTSQAANIMESLEAGATGLLLDEDTCATNFMVRDARMRALIHRDDEPITPFVERVRELHECLGISSVLVMGGCGDYFDAADSVISMREFLPFDVTDKAKQIANESGAEDLLQLPLREAFRAPVHRIPLAASFDTRPDRHEGKIAARGIDKIQWGRESIELRAVEQLVDASQTRAIGSAIRLAGRSYIDGIRCVSEILDDIERHLDEHGLDSLGAYFDHDRDQHPGDFARPRRFEIAAAINRLRSVQMKQK